VSWKWIRHRIRAVVIAVLIIAVPLMTWHSIGWYAPQLEFSDKATITLTATLALFSMLTWITYERLAALAERQNWLTGTIASHSATEFIMRAHECGIPVMWWDPNKEKWDPNSQPSHPGRGHRKITQLPLVFMYVPEDERVHGSKRSAPTARSFTKAERKAIENERQRLKRNNTARTQKGSAK